MKAELQDIKDAWDKDKEGGRDEALARSLSDSYVLANPGEFTGYEGKDIEELAGAIDVFREAGMDEEVQRIETWLLHRFMPQNIGGVYQPQLRLVGGGEE